ncbi:dihydroorotate dehydrogenase electron transfer subunit [bacterium]|nr:dihydroorotate dehydrogenase electron transfer subunit [bacterium]
MGTVIKNIKISHDHHIISIALEEGHAKPKPGQFYMLRCSPSSEPLLRRPLSVNGYSPKPDGSPARLDFLFRIAGSGTMLISRMKEGDHIDLLGPLGNGFELTEPIEHALFIAGGIGIAPLPYLAECLKGKMTLQSANLIAGGKTAEDIVAIEKFKKLGFDISIYTEDGSLGKKGCVTDNLSKALKNFQKPKSQVFVCGPEGMLAKVAQACIAMGIPCKVSLDRRMACGVGACLGCVIKAAKCDRSAPDKIYKRVCIDGPVFNAQEILWPWSAGDNKCGL